MASNDATIRFVLTEEAASGPSSDASGPRQSAESATASEPRMAADEAINRKAESELNRDELTAIALATQELVEETKLQTETINKLNDTLIRTPPKVSESAPDTVPLNRASDAVAQVPTIATKPEGYTQSDAQDNGPKSNPGEKYKEVMDWFAAETEKMNRQLKAVYEKAGNPRGYTGPDVITPAGGGPKLEASLLAQATEGIKAMGGATVVAAGAITALATASVAAVALIELYDRQLESRLQRILPFSAEAAQSQTRRTVAGLQQDQEVARRFGSQLTQRQEVLDNFNRAMEKLILEAAGPIVQLLSEMAKVITSILEAVAPAVGFLSNILATIIKMLPVVVVATAIATYTKKIWELVFGEKEKADAIAAENSLWGVFRDDMDVNRGQFDADNFGEGA